MNLTEAVTAFIDADFARETAFLAELVKMPSDNPPGDCAPHAERARALLEGLGLKVRRTRFPRRPWKLAACAALSI